jgi:transposase
VVEDHLQPPVPWCHLDHLEPGALGDRLVTTAGRETSGELGGEFREWFPDEGMTWLRSVTTGGTVICFNGWRHGGSASAWRRNVLDGQIADTLLNQLGPHTIVLADKAYDADRIRQLIQDHGATPNIPPKSNRRWKPCFSRRLYRERNLIERSARPRRRGDRVKAQRALRV